MKEGEGNDDLFVSSEIQYEVGLIRISDAFFFPCRLIWSAFVARKHPGGATSGSLVLLYIILLTYEMFHLSVFDYQAEYRMYSRYCALIIRYQRQMKDRVSGLEFFLCVDLRSALIDSDFEISTKASKQNVQVQILYFSEWVVTILLTIARLSFGSSILLQHCHIAGILFRQGRP